MKTKLIAFVLAFALLMSVAAFADTQYEAGVYEVVVRGMGGKITFNITFSDNAIVAIDAVKHHETAGIGDRALDNVIPAIIEAQSTEVDAWSGATITSNAIKNAVEEAISQAIKAEPAEAKYVAGTYESVVRGMGGKITFQITFSDTEIVAIDAVKHHETAGIGDRALDNVIPAIIAAQSTEVDAWSGATITSNAIKNAVLDAINQATTAAE